MRPLIVTCNRGEFRFRARAGQLYPTTCSGKRASPMGIRWKYTARVFGSGVSMRPKARNFAEAKIASNIDAARRP